VEFQEFNAFSTIKHISVGSEKKPYNDPAKGDGRMACIH
jgi:hypothetical protein